MNTFLVIGDAEELIDEGCDEFIIAENIIAGNISARKEWLKPPKVLESPWVTWDYGQAINYLWDLRKRILVELSPALERVNHILLSPGEWDLVLCGWMNAFLFSLYDKYLRLKSLRLENIETIGYYPDFRKIGIVDIGAIEASDDCNTMLYAFLCEQMGIKISLKTYSKRIEAAEPKRTGKKLAHMVARVIRDPYFRQYFLNKLSAKFEKRKDQEVVRLSEIPPNCETLLLGSRLPKPVVSEIESSTGGKVSDFDYRYIDERKREILSHIVFDEELRSKIEFKSFTPQNVFEECVIKIVKDVLPLEVVEGFPELYREAHVITEKWNVNKIYSSAYVAFSAMDSICTVLAKRKGAKFVDIQHSGTYGLNAVLSAVERQVADEFLTWGWMPNDGLGSSTVRPVAINRLPRSAVYKEGRKKNRILYASNFVKRYESGSGICDDDYINQHFKFIDSLNQSTRCRLVTRCYISEHSGYGIVPRYKECYPDIELEPVGGFMSFTDSVNASELVVSDDYGSTHIESMIIGVPTMFFLGAHIRIKEQQIMDLLKHLREIKVYAETPEEAARNVMEIENYDEWWNSPEVKAGVKAYLDIVARGYDRMSGVWRGEFV